MLYLSYMNIRELIQEQLAVYYDPSFPRAEYLKWKRNNVSYRGMRDVSNSTENGGMARFGSGLYTAALSNKTMAKGYGDVYFVVNGVPKHPKVIKDANQAEIWIQQNLYMPFSKKAGLNYPDSRVFNEHTTIAKEMMKLGYDGLIISGREMVNYNPPPNVEYFRDESQVQNYFMLNVFGKGTVS